MTHLSDRGLSISGRDPHQLHRSDDRPWAWSMGWPGQLPIHLRLARIW
jgi:hypothetical protein